MREKGLRMVMVMVLLVVGFLAKTSFAANVTYDHRALVIDGKRRVLISGSIHYPRSTPEFDFEGRKDLVGFVKAVAEAGLYVHLRIGPYVCAEWNYGGFPIWLRFVPEIEFRTDNEPFKAEMKRFTAKIVDLMKQEKLYASQGGPIILSQIENEYGNIDSEYGAAGKSYIKWSASMALSLDTGVPWVMCQQANAPDPIINTCNGFYCHQFTPNSNGKPKMWTENYTGWFFSFGNAIPYRNVEDLAFAVARFFQRGGTFQNYYMYHGGTNFGRTTGGPFIATSYDYDAPIDEYGLLRQPKWGHLKDLHKVIKQVEEALVATDPTITSLGSNLEAAVYRTESKCVAFLANVARSDATVTFNDNSYNLPAWSVSILPDCKNVALNTAKINSMAMIPSFTRQSLIDGVNSSQSLGSAWSWINEPVGISKDDAFTKPGLLEQISTTADQSDYLWYSLSIDVKGDEPYLDGSKTYLHVESLGHALHAFINGKPAGSVTGNSTNPNVLLEIPVTLVSGKNTIDLLSLTVGLQHVGGFLEKVGAGITGPVKLKSAKSGNSIDLSSQQWTYQIGLKGEELDLPSVNSSQWSQSTLPKKQPLTWYKTNFDAPGGSSPVALNFTGMGKGEAWVNGQSIGRYWPTYAAPNSDCTDICDYGGAFNASKLYHVPRRWLKPRGNTLVLFEEIGGDPTQISLSTRQIESLCSQISETHPPPVDMWSLDSESSSQLGRPVMSLQCLSPNQVVSSIKFASFGTPNGSCGNFTHGNCSSATALSLVQKACIGSNSCKIGVTVDTFGDPCFGVVKSLAVEVSCS